MNILANVFARWAVALGYDAAVSERGRRDLPFSRKQSRDEDRFIGAMDREIVRARCWDLRRNNSLVAGVVERFADNVVGEGIKPQAKTSDPAWNAAAESFWGEWSKVADYRQRCSMRDLQRLTVQLRMLSGELAMVLLSNGQVQPIECDRIATPDKLTSDANLIDGFRVDPGTGIITGAYIHPRDETGRVDRSGAGEFVPRSDLLYMSRPIRFDQVRGIPDLAPVVNNLLDVGELSAAQLGKAKLDAINARAVKKDGGGPGNLGPRLSDQGVGSTQLEKVENLQVIYLKPGESTESLASNTPNAQYSDFMELNLRMIGAALGLPYEFFMLDFSKGNFASSRAALLQTYRTFAGWQEWVAVGQQRLWNWRIAKAIKAGDLPPAPMDPERGVSQWYRVQWQFPEWDWVDPQSQQQSDLMAWQMGSKTLTEITRKRGRDSEDVLTEKASDIAAAARIASEANASLPGLALTWRDLISAQIPGQMQPAPAAAAGAAKPAQREP